MSEQAYDPEGYADLRLLTQTVRGAVNARTSDDGNRLIGLMLRGLVNPETSKLTPKGDVWLEQRRS